MTAMTCTFPFNLFQNKTEQSVGDATGKATLYYVLSPVVVGALRDLMRSWGVTLQRYAQNSQSNACTDAVSHHVLTEIEARKK